MEDGLGTPSGSWWKLNSRPFYEAFPLMGLIALLSTASARISSPFSFTGCQGQILILPQIIDLWVKNFGWAMVSPSKPLEVRIRNKIFAAIGRLLRITKFMAESNQIKWTLTGASLLFGLLTTELWRWSNVIAALRPRMGAC